MNADQANELLSIVGVSQGGFSWAQIIAWLVFGIIGFAAFVYGKREKNYRVLFLSIALMAYPYFVQQVFWLYAVGIGLCLALYFWRE